MIRKSRNEMVHSSFILELLAGEFFRQSQESALMHFLDIIVKRAKQQNVVIDGNLKEAIITRKLPVEEVLEKRVELTLSEYNKMNGQNGEGKNIAIDENGAKTGKSKQERLDVYLKYRLNNDKKRGIYKYASKACKNNSAVDALELFIENKIYSTEHDNQTQTYYDNCTKGKQGQQKPFKLFVYITPISSRELDNYQKLPDDEKPKATNNNKEQAYVYINYQDLLETVIEPLIIDNTIGEKIGSS